MKKNRDGDSIAIARCRDNNDSTDITSNTEHQGEIKENSIGELDNTDIVTDKSFNRKRNKTADPSSWKRYKQKEQGMKGKADKGLSKRGTKYNFIAKRGEWVMNLKERYISEEKNFLIILEKHGLK